MDDPTTTPAELAWRLTALETTVHDLRDQVTTLATSTVTADVLNTMLGTLRELLDERRKGDRERVDGVIETVRDLRQEIDDHVDDTTTTARTAQRDAVNLSWTKLGVISTLAIGVTTVLVTLMIWALGHGHGGS